MIKNNIPNILTSIRIFLVPVFLFYLLIEQNYLITFIVFLVWIFFIDKFDIITQIKMNKEFKQLKQQQEFYKEEIEKDSTKIYNLNNNPEEQERFARERFLMKKENEDLFIIREKKKNE